MITDNNAIPENGKTTNPKSAESFDRLVETRLELAKMRERAESAEKQLEELKDQQYYCARHGTYACDPCVQEFIQKEGELQTKNTALQAELDKAHGYAAENGKMVCRQRTVIAALQAEVDELKMLRDVLVHRSSKEVAEENLRLQAEVERLLKILGHHALTDVGMNELEKCQAEVDRLRTMNYALSQGKVKELMERVESLKVVIANILKWHELAHTTPEMLLSSHHSKEASDKCAEIMSNYDKALVVAKHALNEVKE